MSKAQILGQSFGSPIATKKNFLTNFFLLQSHIEMKQHLLITHRLHLTGVCNDFHSMCMDSTLKKYFIQRISPSQQNCFEF